MINPFSIKAKADNTAEVFIYGDIGPSWDGESVEAKAFVTDFAAIQADLITVRINSLGGSVNDGIAIYNAIKRHPAAIQIHIDGIAASIASMIAMAGDEVIIAENALLMIHAPWTFAAGNSSDLRQVAEVLDKYAAAMSSAYAAKTGQSAAAIMSLLTDGQDHWYTASEAINAGFANTLTASLPVAARYQRDAAQRFSSFPSHLSLKEVSMSVKPANNEAPLATSPDPEKTEPKIDVKAIKDEAVKAEAQRRAEVKHKFRNFLKHEGVDALLETCLEDIHCTTQDAAEKLLAHLGKDVAPIQAGYVSVVEDEQDKFIEGNTNALLACVGMAQQDRGNPYRGLGIRGVSANCLKKVRARIDGLHVEEYAHLALSRFPVLGAQTTSDFPVILENTMHKIILTGFRAIATTWQRIAKIGDVTDFRIWNRIVPGLIGNLDGVTEHGEYLNKIIPDGVKNPIQATRKGNIIQITPEVLINDDMGYVRDMASGLGAAGARAIERKFYAYLESNPTLSDGITLFHASHGNLATSGTVPSVDNLDTARVVMAQQTAPGPDAEYLDIRPQIALVNIAGEGNMRVIINAQYDPDTPNKLQRPNKVQGLVSDIVSTPRIATNPWYLFADPSIAPVIEVVFLNGQREPRLTIEENFRTSGLAWKVELPFGVGAIDYRGVYKNPGA